MVWSRHARNQTASAASGRPPILVGQAWVELSTPMLTIQVTPELVDGLAVLVAPHLLGQLDLDLAALAQTREPAAQLVGVVAGQGHAAGVAGQERLAGRTVGTQDDDAVADGQGAVHDPAGVLTLHAHVAERHQLQVAAEDGLVEGHRLAGGAVEVSVGAQVVGHACFDRPLPRNSSLGSRRTAAPTRPGWADRPGPSGSGQAITRSSSAILARRSGRSRRSRRLRRPRPRASRTGRGTALEGGSR